MKRLMLGSLLSCMMVSQAFDASRKQESSFVDETISFCRGAVHALTFPVLFGSVGYLLGGDKWGVIGANAGSVRGHLYWGSSALQGKTDTNWDSFSGYVTASSLLHFASLVYLSTNHDLKLNINL